MRFPVKHELTVTPAFTIGIQYVEVSFTLSSSFTILVVELVDVSLIKLCGKKEPVVCFRLFHLSDQISKRS